MPGEMGAAGPGEGRAGVQRGWGRGVKVGRCVLGGLWWAAGRIQDRRLWTSGPVMAALSLGLLRPEGPSHKSLCDLCEGWRRWYRTG